MNRRRFLQLSAAFACAPHLATASTWRGRALGGEVSLTLHGPKDAVAPVLDALPDWLDAFEQEFSLYRPDSALTRLNATGFHAGTARFHTLMDHVQKAYDLTGGLFDPTVQPLWVALAQGQDPVIPRTLIGWDKVIHAPQAIQLAQHQKLTLNGIAQGFATDLLRAQLMSRGFDKALINIGEFSALGGPFRLGISDPTQGLVGQRSLDNRAIATSSPEALRLGRTGHILSPDGRPALWSTVAIEADTATLADALSTAGVFMSLDELATLKSQANIHRITVVDAVGNVRTL